MEKTLNPERGLDSRAVSSSTCKVKLFSEVNITLRQDKPNLKQGLGLREGWLFHRHELMSVEL